MRPIICTLSPNCCLRFCVNLCSSVVQLIYLWILFWKSLFICLIISKRSMIYSTIQKSFVIFVWRYDNHSLTWCSIDFYSDITAVWIELFVQIKWFIQRYFKEITTRIVRYLYLSVKIARWLVENGECWRCMLIILLFELSRFDYWECFMLLWSIVFLIFPSFYKKRHWRNMKNYSRIKYLLRSSNHLVENL